MATFNGYIHPLPELTERTHDLDALRTRTSPQEDRQGLGSALSLFGDATDTQPVELVSEARGGVMQRSFFEDYYNRVYFLPASVQFGPISATTERRVRVWNAYLHDVVLNDITLIDAEGLSIAGEATPFTFLPLQFVNYTLIASINGLPELHAGVLFDFDTEDYLLSVNGSRAKIATVSPNWKNAYTIEYQFKTEVFTSRSGKEQRRALRTTPRKSLSFQATPTFGALRAFNEIMASWQNNVIVLPEVPRQALFSVPMAGGEFEVTLAAAAPDWIAPGVAVILNFGTVYETRRVESVDIDQVTFTGASALDWPAGTKMHPALGGRLGLTVQSKRETNAVAVVSVEFAVTPASEPVLPLPDAPVVFNGREAFLVKPNWGSQPDVTYEGNREDIDYDRGLVTTFTPIDFTTRLHRFTFTGRAYSDMLLIENSFKRMRGQRGEFYMPTWENDIVPRKTASAGSNTLSIAGPEFGAAYQDSTLHRAVMVLLADGTMKLNMVQDIYVVDDSEGLNSAVQFQDPWGVDLTPENVRMISWLFCCRHATDTLTIEWMTNTVGQVQLNVRVLEDLE